MPDFFLSATMYYTAISVAKFPYWKRLTGRSAWFCMNKYSGCSVRVVSQFSIVVTYLACARGFYDDIYVLLVVYSVELCVVLNVWSYVVIIILLTVAHIAVAARLLLVLPTYKN